MHYNIIIIVINILVINIHILQRKCKLVAGYNDDLQTCTMADLVVDK